MSEESKNSAYNQLEKENKSSKRNIIIIVFLVAIVAIIGVKFYLDSEKENEELQQNLEQTYGELDSISTQLDMKIAEIESLGGDISELQLIRKNLESEKEELKKSNNWAANQIQRYKDKVGGYEELLNLQDEKIARLEAINKELLSENTNLKTEKNQLNDSISRLKNNREELEDKVEMASRLKAENIKIIAINSRGRERDDKEYKPRHIEKLKIQFNLAENSVAQPEGKDIILRVINPIGNALFDVNTGSGSFMIDGKEMFYTAKQEILFDNTQQELSFIYDRGEEYEEGVYQLELYADNYLIGKEKFSVN
ncbi:chromosome segregation protein SMC [Marivirga harenae]|uniref:chromosome segregation protein SMC n=1 Tax=Marivirga harenae TaxID=2010992 RepID=UPI0026E0E7F2|nr:chromosome segregation protein SMC [Marivirga harenae]WKV11668.1 chromosome segregation protein SMC [Marivirga harenae]|tara:strand:+ start:175276 stop:176208 length:933 start_codon:yes stop_codon:yes gene_type:complete